MAEIMLHHTKCSGCGARNSIPATGLTMVCEYCGFSRPVPDAEKRRKKIERAEARQRKQAQAQARTASRLASHREVPRRSSVGKWIGLVILLVVLGPIISVLVQTGSVVRTFRRLAGSSHRGDATGSAAVSIDRTAQRHFDRGAKSLRGESYIQQGGARSGDTADPLVLDVAQGTCYALLVASRQQIEVVRLVVPSEPVTAQPRRFAKHRVVARYCPDDSGKIRATVTLRRSGTYAWALFSRPFDATGKRARPAPRRRPSQSYGSRPSPRRPRRQPPRKSPRPRKTPERQAWTPHEEY